MVLSKFQPFDHPLADVLDQKVLRMLGYVIAINIKKQEERSCSKPERYPKPVSQVTAPNFVHHRSGFHMFEQMLLPP